MDSVNKNLCNQIRNKYILRNIFELLREHRLLQIIQYNKYIQKRIDKGIIDYINYKKIIIELIPINIDYKNYFIYISEKEKPYFHIYFNDERRERKKTYFNKNQNVKKIKIIIDEEIKSLSKLFSNCKCIEKINLIKFNRKDIIDMRNMFYECSSLKELNLNNFNTINVTDMSYMFFECSSLKELNLNNFNINNVTNMYRMFSKCSDDLKMKIKLENKNIKAEAFY